MAADLRPHGIPTVDARVAQSWDMDMDMSVYMYASAGREREIVG